MSRSLLLVAVILAIVSFASAASLTLYSDAGCVTMNGGVQYGAANSCIDEGEGSGYVTCGPTVGFTIWNAASCAGNSVASGFRNSTQSVDTCITLSAANGAAVQYAKIDCNASSAATVAFSSMLLAVLAFAANRVASL